MTRSNQRRPNLSGAGARWRPGRRYWRARPRRRNADRPRWPATFPRNSPAGTWTPANSSRTGLFTPHRVTLPNPPSGKPRTPGSATPKGLTIPDHDRKASQPPGPSAERAGTSELRIGSSPILGRSMAPAAEWPAPRVWADDGGDRMCAGPGPGGGTGLRTARRRPSRRRPADRIGTQAARTADVSIRLGLGAPASGAGCPGPPAANPDCFVTGDSPIWGNHPLTWRGDGQGTAIS